MTKTSANFNGISFYHPEGFVPAYKNVSALAGRHGRFATLPDILDARIANPGKPGLTPWSSYFTTATAEYVGDSAGGTRIIIVAQGIGPMSSLDGILKAYSYHFKDDTRSRSGGRISKEEFRKLESGHYGDVSIVDFDELLRNDDLAMYRTLRASAAATNPLVAARLGARAADYIKAHAAMAQYFYDEREKISGPGIRQEDPFILSMHGGGSGCSYQYDDLEDGAIAHLLSIGQVQPTGHSSDRHSYTSLLSDVSTHGWHDGTRLAGVRDGGKLIGIHPGFDRFDGLLEKYWADFMKPVRTPRANLGMRILTKIGKNWFTQHPKQGERMDTGEPEFLVTKREGIPGPGHFATSEGGGFFLKYGIKEIERIAPPGANAYTLGDVGKTRGDMLMSIKFWRVEVDTSRRLPRMSRMHSDFDTIMKVLAKDDKAA